MPKLSADHRRALELIAGSPTGMTDSLLMAHGVTRSLVAELMLEGLASADTERMMAGVRSVDVRRFKITDAGRVALERSSCIMHAAKLMRSTRGAIGSGPPSAWRFKLDRLPTAPDLL